MKEYSRYRIDSSLQNFREMFSPQEIVDNYKNGIDFTENQRSELSESESDAAEGDKNDIVSGENRNSESDSAEDEIAVNSSGSDSSSVLH